MKLLWVTYFILNINAAIDTGKESKRTEGRATAATEKGFPSPISRRPHCPPAAIVRLGGACVNGALACYPEADVKSHCGTHRGDWPKEGQR